MVWHHSTGGTAVKALLRGFGCTLALAALLIVAACGLIELAAWLWRELHAMHPLLVVPWACCAASVGLAALEKAAALMGL